MAWPQATDYNEALQSPALCFRDAELRQCEAAVDVLNAQTQLFSTQRDLARARYDVLVGSLRLRQVAGQLQPADLSPINALLAPQPAAMPR